MQDDTVLATLGAVKTVGGKQFFKVSLADACTREMLAGYRSRRKARIADWGLPQKLRELIVAKSTIDQQNDESAPVEAIVELVEDEASNRPKRRRGARRLLKVMSEHVEIRCPPSSQSPVHCMCALPIFATKGRASGSLWVEATAKNVAYLISAYDDWVEAVDAAATSSAAAASAPAASASAPVADIESIVADPESLVDNGAPQAPDEA